MPTILSCNRYEIARLLRRLQKLPSLARCILDGCDQRLAQQLATAPLTRLSQLVLLRLHDLTPLDLLYIAQAQSSVRQMLVRECAKLSKAICVDLPRAANRPLLQMLT